jgi:putative flippase GtrA
MRRLLSFVLAGTIGFITDAAGLLVLLSVTPLDPFVARLLSMGLALLVTWQINRHMTFGPSGHAIPVEGARYGGVGIVTSAVNYLVFSAALLAAPEMPPLLALAIASAVAMAFSYAGYSRLVFSRR